MAIPFDEILKKLPAEEQAAIEARSRELVAEYLTLQDLRKARALTQERMAELLNIKQENVSRLEKRTDLLLSILNSYVTAMGGKLRLVAEFPNRPSVVLTGLSAMENGQDPSGRKREP
ncbi:MAG: helix-turn-helix domain-containing protein [Nitrococcus sp.]|nr:helix-turn-helix domain-containing protein [Nitrococcus sp.]